MNSHHQVRGHGTGSSTLELRIYPREKQKPKEGGTLYKYVCACTRIDVDVWTIPAA